MGTKTTQELQPQKDGYIGLMGAQKTIHKVLKEMVNGTPIHYQHLASDREAVYVFIGNGICATLHIQPLNPRQEGGQP